MSRIGNQPIKILSGVQINLDNNLVSIQGPKGQLSLQVRPEIKIEINDNQIKVERALESRIAQSLHGLTRTLLSNMITGVTEGWEKTLELVGVGYRAAKQGEDLTLNLGFSHPVKVSPPKGISFSVEGAKVTVLGIDKVQVGQVAASIRHLRPPEPYKGKGIRYQGEIVRRKPGKAAKVGSPSGGK